MGYVGDSPRSRSLSARHGSLALFKVQHVRASWLETPGVSVPSRCGNQENEKEQPAEDSRYRQDQYKNGGEAPAIQGLEPETSSDDARQTEEDQ